MTNPETAVDKGEGSPAEIAAKRVGIRADQVERVLEEYRSAARDVEEEPEWTAQTHISGFEFGMHSYIAEGTEIMLSIENWVERGKWKSGRSYHWRGRAYEEWGAARYDELLERARPVPYIVPAPSQTEPSPHGR